jgi:hypothetical protein
MVHKTISKEKTVSVAKKKIPDVLEQLKASIEDIKAGRVHPFKY